MKPTILASETVNARVTGNME